jgi:hypothetical protein
MTTTRVYSLVEAWQAEHIVQVSPTVALHLNPGFELEGHFMYLNRFFRTFGAPSKPLRSANPLSTRE